MGLYVTGLLLDGERKSIEPIAARLVDDVSQTQAMRQRLQQCVVVSSWAEAEILARLGRTLDRELPEVEAFIVDDTGFPKKGRHSVGVARQYSGTLGRIDNCQVATSLHLAGERGSGCIGMRLYLPEVWTRDRKRRRGVGVPDEVEFATKWEHALALLDNALAAGVRKHVVLGDAAFGDAVHFREELTTRGLPYLLRVQGVQVVWPPETSFAVPKKRVAKGPLPRHVARKRLIEPMSISSSRFEPNIGSRWIFMIDCFDSTSLGLLSCAITCSVQNRPLNHSVNVGSSFFFSPSAFCSEVPDVALPAPAAAIARPSASCAPSLEFARSWYGPGAPGVPDKRSLVPSACVTLALKNHRPVLVSRRTAISIGLPSRPAMTSTTMT